MENSESSILKVYASTTDRVGSKLLYEYIVELARDKGISGVTVYRGVMGFGLSSQITSAKFWELTEKLPVMIEIIDSYGGDVLKFLLGQGNERGQVGIVDTRLLGKAAVIGTGILPLVVQVGAHFSLVEHAVGIGKVPRQVGLVDIAIKSLIKILACGILRGVHHFLSGALVDHRHHATTGGIDSDLQQIVFQSLAGVVHLKHACRLADWFGGNIGPVSL